MRASGLLLSVEEPNASNTACAAGNWPEPEPRVAGEFPRDSPGEGVSVRDRGETFP